MTRNADTERNAAAEEAARKMNAPIRDALHAIRSADTLASLKLAREKLATVLDEADADLERRLKRIEALRHDQG